MLERHQKNLDELCSYDGRLSIDGEPYKTDVLKMLYMEALDNICSEAVLDLLSSIDSSDTREALVNEVFLDISISQQKKTRFLSELKRMLKKPAQKITYTESEVFSQYTVENTLMKLGVEAKLNTAAKRMEISFTGACSLYDLYSRENILSVLPTVLRDNLRADGVIGLGQGTKMIEQYLFNIADQNRFNPICEMLEEYENDDKGNLEVLFALLGLEDDFDKLLVSKWFIQCAALAFNKRENPISAEGVLVLQGRQGCGKTSFFRRMAVKPEWFTEGAVIDVRNKDSLITALSAWICELGEIDCTLKREQSALKAFVTRPLDKIRFPYAPSESELVRTTSLCGTVNPDKFLNDLTGARRYWVVSVDNIAKDCLFSMSDEEIKNIWGYIYHLYKEDNSSFRLNDEQREQLENRNRVYSCELKFEAEVLELLDFSLEECYWSEVNPARLAAFMGNVSAVQVGKILSKLSDEDDRVKKNRHAKMVSYTLPLKKGIVSDFNNRGIKLY